MLAHLDFKSLINPIYSAPASGVLCLFPVFKFRDSSRVLPLPVLLVCSQVHSANLGSASRRRRTQTLRFEHFVCSSSSYTSSFVRSFALKFHLVLKAFLYVRFDCFSASLLPRLGRLLRVFSFVRLTLTSFLVVIAHTSLSAAQCLLFRRRRRYKIRSSVFGGLPTTTSQNGVASLSAFYLALLSRTHTHSSISVSTNTTNSKSRLRPRYTRRNCVDVASWWYS